MKFLTAVLVALCLAFSWYYAHCIDARFGVGLKPGQVNDYFQLWNASRAILRQADPYGPEVTLQNQIAVYGTTAKALGMKIDRRLIYPIQATFPLLPLGWLEFHVADKIALCLMATLVALSIGWLRGAWDRTTILYVFLAFSSYPVIVALQMRQPTLLFFGLILGSFALLRSRHLIWAGFLAALACSKPQIAFPVLVPMMVWALAKWHERKRFLIALAASELAFLSLGGILSPGWISEWLSALRDYPTYVHSSVAVFLFGNRGGLFVSGILFIGLAAVLWRHHDHDLSFLAAVSAAVFMVVIQREIYNLVILVVPAVWVADHAQQIRASGPANQLVLAIVRVAFLEFWLAAALGGVLMNTTPLGQSIAWWFSTNMAVPVLWSLVAMMVLQVFSSPPTAVRKEEAIASASSLAGK